MFPARLFVVLHSALAEQVADLDTSLEQAGRESESRGRELRVLQERHVELASSSSEQSQSAVEKLLLEHAILSDHALRLDQELRDCQSKLDASLASGRQHGEEASRLQAELSRRESASATQEAAEAGHQGQVEVELLHEPVHGASAALREDLLTCLPDGARFLRERWRVEG